MFILFVLLIVAIYTVSMSTERGIIPFVREKGEWSIGIYIGDSIFNLAPSQNIKNPVLTAEDVTDISAYFIADPFMVRENSTWYMFFEVYNNHTLQGDIGYAVSSDGFNWTYQHIVLDESFHLSYPYVFQWEGAYYMIPESHEVGSLRLYKALRFPSEWNFIGTLLTGIYKDPSIFRYDNRWWLFAQTNPEANDTLCLYYADTLTGPWIKHPKNPLIIGDANIARPGGRVLVYDRIIRYVQDDYPTYGNQVRAFEVTVLTTENYEEREASEPIVIKASGTGWNKDGMHHVDAHQIDEKTWIACVDGYREHLVFGWMY